MVARLRDSRVLAHIVAVLQSVRARAQFFEASLTPGVAFPPNFAPRIASQLLWRRFCRKFITRGLLWTQVYVAVARCVMSERGRTGGMDAREESSSVSETDRMMPEHEMVKISQGADSIGVWEIHWVFHRVRSKVNGLLNGFFILGKLQKWVVETCHRIKLESQWIFQWIF